MINIFKENNINWTDGMSAMMDARAVKSVDEQECFRIVGAIGDATHWECMKFLRPGITENQVTAHLMEYHSFPMRRIADRGHLVLADATRWECMKFLRPGIT